VINKKRVLIIGGSSFIGINLIQYFLECNFEVIVYGRIKPVIENERMKFISAEMSDFDIHSATLKKLEIHTAIYLVNTFAVNLKAFDYDKLFDINKVLIAKIFDVVERFIFFSSGGRVYQSSDAPHNENDTLLASCDYGQSKVELEKFVSEVANLKNKFYLIVRPSNPYGPYQSLEGSQGLIAVLIGRISSNDVVDIWGTGFEIRDYIYIGDFVKIFYKLYMLSSPKYNVYNVGSGHGTSTLQILDIVKNHLGYNKINVKFSPEHKIIRSNVLCNARIHDEIGRFDYTSLNAGIAEFIRWLNK